jgi:predicted nucleic acid-binding protein
MSLVYWDTMLFVYWFEDNRQYAERVGVILSGMEARGDQLLTSTFTLGELLAGPIKLGATDLARRMRASIQDIAQLLPFTTETAERYAEIRAMHGVSPADAIHLACASRAQCDLFLTNDRLLVGKTIPGIQFIAGLDLNLY